MDNSHATPTDDPHQHLPAEYTPGRRPGLPAHLLDLPEADFNGESESSSFLEYWQVVRRHKGAILLITFLGAVGGLLFGVPQTPVYQASISLEIQRSNENFLNMANVNPTNNYADPQYDIQTQVRILQSPALIERVAAKLKMEQRPEIAAAPDRWSEWRKVLGLPPPSPASLREQSLATAGGDLKVRTSGQNRIVDVFFDSTDPQLAADFANTLAQEFIDQNLEARWNATQHTGEWLGRQMQDLKIKLEKSEDQLQAYAQASGLVFTGEKDKENVVEEKLKQLQQELSKAQSDRISKQSQYEMAQSSPAEALAEVLDSESLRSYETKLSELRRQSADLRSSLTPAHPKVKRVEAQIPELESSLKKERVNILTRIQKEYESAQRRERLLAIDYANQAKIVSDQAAKMIHYNILKREVDTNRQLYEVLLQKVKEAGIASAMRASNVRVVDPAKPPRHPYKPNLVLNTALGVLAGFFLGMVFVLLRERSDRSFRSPGDAAFYLKMPELGVIPSTRSDGAKRSYGGRRQLVITRKNQTLALALRDPSKTNGGASEAANETSPPREGAADRVELVTWQHKPSLVAESFRAVLASILFSGQNGGHPRVIVLTSPSPAEGKTTVVSNLGIALAEINRNVLLIDADMRKPRLHDVFNVPNSWGLSDLLRERSSIEERPREALVRETEIPGLFLLPSGPGTASISNLLYSARVPELLRRFRREFDTVLIDTPPMLQISDARVLGRLADAVILVVRASRTTRDSALAASQRFAEDGTPMLGTILNNWSPTTSANGYYDSYYTSYYGKGERS